MLLPVEDEVGVNFVADHQDVVFQAQLHHPAEVLLSPDDAHRVVGAAQQKQVRLPELFLQVRPVHRPPAVSLHKPVFQDLPAGKLGHVVKLAVNRGLNQHAAALGSIELNHGAEGLHHPQAEAHEGRVGGPAVPAALPIPYGLKIAGGPGGVAPEALLRPGLQGVDDGLCGFEVHVGNPQGNHILRAKLLDPLVILGGAVSLAVDYLVKVIAHGLASFLNGLYVFGVWQIIKAKNMPNRRPTPELPSISPQN